MPSAPAGPTSSRVTRRHGRGAADDTAKGTKLVERFFDLLVDGNTAGMEKFLSPAFQLQGADGGFLDKEEFIADPPPAPRLSVFTKGKRGWRIVAHANFNVPAEEPQQ